MRNSSNSSLLIENETTQDLFRGDGIYFYKIDPSLMCQLYVLHKNFRSQK